MKVNKADPLCDFCAAGEPAWTYDVPRGFVLMAVKDTLTGKAEVTQSASGLICACVECDAIINGPRSVRVSRLARRIFLTNPVLRSMPDDSKRAAKAAGKKTWSRWLANMSGRRPCERGEDPLEGVQLFIEPGEEMAN